MKNKNTWPPLQIVCVQNGIGFILDLLMWAISVLFNVTQQWNVFFHTNNNKNNNNIVNNKNQKSNAWHPQLKKYAFALHVQQKRCLVHLIGLMKTLQSSFLKIGLSTLRIV